MSLESMVRSLDRSNPTPLYRQLRRSLREAINQDVLAPDDSLPAERDIAEDFGVSRITVRKAIASRIQKNMATLSSFSEDIASRGWQSSSEWLSKAEAKVTPSESLALGLPPETVVYKTNPSHWNMQSYRPHACRPWMPLVRRFTPRSS